MCAVANSLMALIARGARFLKLTPKTWLLALSLLAVCAVPSCAGLTLETAR